MHYVGTHPICANEKSVIELAFSDIDQQAARLSGYEQQYQQLGVGRFEGAFLTCEYDKEFSINIETVNRKLFQRFQVPEDRYAICIMMDANEDTLINALPFSHNETIILAPGSETIVSTSSIMQICVISVARNYLEESILFETVPIINRLTDEVNLVQNCNPYSSAHLLRSIDSSIHHMSKHCDLSSDQHNSFVHENKLALISSVFSVFSDPTTTRICKKHDKYTEQQQMFNAVKATIDDYIADSATIAELCETHAVSRRTVENTFQRFIGTPPNTYVRAVRMNEARRDLQSPQNKEIAIGDIAAKWGIWHSGRFASDYRTMFGELPSETKDRASRQNAR